MTGATEALAVFASRADVGGGPDRLRWYARRSVADTVAAALGAAQEDVVRIVAQTIGGGAGEGASVWATGERTSVERAALLNGVAAHALDYDDVAEAVHTHPGAVMVPALLAVAEEGGALGRDVLDAFVVGYEVQHALAAGMDLEAHIARGWHGTSTIALLGGAAAVARLMKLDVARIRTAIAIAASLAGGSRQNFGTMTKPFHAGMAARDSVLAARLAAAGMIASLSQVEGAAGYLANFGDGPLGGERIVEAIARPWFMLRDGINLKPYPCCYRAARTAHAATLLHAKGVEAAQVKRATITIEPRGTAPLIYSRPSTGLEGKFSAEYILASGLLDGVIGLGTFTDAAVNRPAVQELLRAVDVGEAAIPPFGPPGWEGGYAAVVLDLHDGRQIRERVDVPHGHDRDPLTEYEIDRKIAECVAFGGVGLDPGELVAQLHDLDTDTPFGGLAGQGRRAGTRSA